MFDYASLTKQGAALITRATNGENFVFTRMEYGDGVPEGFSTSKTDLENKEILSNVTSLVSKKADIGMYKISVKNNCATLTGKIINSSLTNDFLAKELGVYGKIGNESDVLVAYFVASQNPDPISQSALVGQEHKVIVDVAVGNASEITIEYNPEVYANKEEFDAAIAQNAEEHTALEQAIADEATARTNADTALQQSITDLEASIDEKIGSIDISAALSHIKQYDFVVDSNETLLAWANCTDGSMKSVLVKSGEYTLDGKMINLVNAGTKFVFAEDGNKITVSNYMRGIGATEDYGAVIIGLNVEANYNGREFYAFYRGMICYNCTGTSTGNCIGYGFYNCTCSNCTGNSKGTGSSNYGYGFYNCTCSNCTGSGRLAYGFYNCTCSNCTGSSNYGYGFFNCTCSNCTGTGIGSLAYGFFNCTCSNCTGTGTGILAYGFCNCTCSNCTGTGTGNGSGDNGYGFYSCTCSNCTGTGAGSGDNGYGFYSCTCSNCTGTGTGTVNGYGFYNCKHCSSCRAGNTKSSKATWGGANTYIDSDSCDYVAA